MSKKKSKNNKKIADNKQKFIIGGLVLMFISLLTLASILGFAGEGGIKISEFTYLILGAGQILIPIIFFAASIYTFRRKLPEISIKQIISGILGILSLFVLLSLFSPTLGGNLGNYLALPLVETFEKGFSVVIIVFVILVSFTLFFEQAPSIPPFIKNLFHKLNFFKKRDEDEYEEVYEYEEVEYEEEVDEEEAEIPTKAPAVAKAKKDPELKISDSSNAGEDIAIDTKFWSGNGSYTPPPLSLLEGDRGKANVGDVKSNANTIRRTLLNFGIEVEMDEITIGPTVTRYALKPAQGVKLSRIVGLQSDLALALAAHPLRIEAPIPGKALVGIEIPNKSKATVGLASLISDKAFTQAKPLTAAIGRNIAGKPVLYSIAKMPHLLIAGTTGSGKSVTIHAIISSLLYRHGPDDMRFIFVDPKRVELTLYNSIPHLLTPVITDPKKAVLALKWAATEMNRRYDILESEGVRDIDSYHKKYAKEFAKGASANDDENPIDRMPYIVIVIDELADIMQAYPREMESAIVRLAQMSRAVGIHLILSTQRPEVNVITGLIKANVPSRIALRVPTQIDSRTILDTAGAEKLLGQGDMLAMVGTNQAERLQSAFITEDEVKSVVKYLKEQYKDDVRETIEISNTGNLSGDRAMFSDSLEESDDDPLYEEARTIIIEAGKASTSYIQRKLKVGYARAARLMDMLEERGIIGPADGAKPREVLTGNITTSDDIANDMGL